VIEAIATGATQIAVGTHALFQEQVAFRSLALAIVDEQPPLRRGAAACVAQQGAGALRGKASASWEAHLLMMSATPIPRTLSMSYYAIWTCR